MSEKNLIPETLDPREATVRISMVVEGALLLDIKRRAQNMGLPYQTFMKMTLRNSFAEMDRVQRMAQDHEAKAKKRKAAKR